MPHFYRTSLLALLLLYNCDAQLLKWDERIPRRAHPPVVFVTGHDAVCPQARAGETSMFNLTFGKFDEVMARSGRVSLVFEACYLANHPPIENLAAFLGSLISWMTYEDGEPVAEVDVVAHSMGGLIVRAYLAGKQSPPGMFAPPATPRIRKAVFIGTPHFGTSVASAYEADPQLREMSLGSLFLFELATWNQGREDLRGVDALSIIGTGGINGEPGFTDSVVVLTSGALKSIPFERTIILPLCHTAGGIGALLLCNGAAGIAKVQDERHPTAAAILSFLNGGREWEFIGQRAAQNPILAGAAAVVAQLRTADDNPVAIQSASLRVAGQSLPLRVSEAGLAYAEKVPAGPAQMTLNGQTHDVELKAGGGEAIIVKPGPLIMAVEPASGANWPLVLAPGMRVTVKGWRLSDAEVSMMGLPVPLIARTAESLVVVLPEQIAGPVTLTAKNLSGQHTVRIYVEAANPLLYQTRNIAAALHAATGRPITSEEPTQPARSFRCS